MAVAYILDFPGATRAEYDEMELDGRMAPGGIVHTAGSYEGGWRVVDVWEDHEHFARFRDEKIIPFSHEAGMPAPGVRVLEVDEVKPGSGAPPAFVQVVTLPGIGREAFHAADRVILPDGQAPAEVTFHVNGPVEGGWCVIDGWTSKAARDEFMEARVRGAMADAPLTGPPRFEDLDVEASLTEPAAAPA
jgi:quinol monooxygenase YgiN